MFLMQVVDKEALSFALPIKGDKPEPAQKKIPRSELCGCMEVWLSDDFDAPLEEMREYME
jgi:hypothetical protein